ncbi:hypothetical protein ACFE04_005207 [Oxalis oulophora]
MFYLLVEFTSEKIFLIDGSFSGGCAYSVFGSILTLGALLGAIISGTLADCIGRRRDALCLDIGRLSIGFGGGLATYVVPVYLVEIAPKNVRGGFALANQLFSTSAFGLFFFIGNFLSWRTLALIGAFPSLIQFIGLFFIPESPRWLAKSDQEKEVEASLQRLRGIEIDISKEAADIREDYTKSVQQISVGKFLDLFQMRYANAYIICVGLVLCQQLGGYSAVTFYLASIYEKADVSRVIGTTGIAALQIPTAFIVLLLMDKCGRRPLLLISASGYGLCCLVIGFAFCLQKHHYMKNFIPVIVLLATWGLGMFYEIGMSGIPLVIMYEIFPINIKGLAGSLVTSVSMVSSALVAYAFSFIFQWTIPGTFFIFAGIWVMSIIFITKVVPETKGRSLEEIQA